MMRRTRGRRGTWKTPTGGSVYSSPAVVGGVVHVGSRDGNVYALDAATGAVGGTTPPSVTAMLPSAPASLSAIGGNAQVRLSWTAPESNGGAAVRGYNVYRGTSAGAESATPLATTGASATTYTDSSVTNGVRYYCKVAAVNSAGTGVMSV
ncbi:MAG: fibronectin type III domain-containing protein [Candidatus Thermoplasmatota archaeon]